MEYGKILIKLEWESKGKAIGKLVAYLDHISKKKMIYRLPSLNNQIKSIPQGAATLGNVGNVLDFVVVG